MKQYNVTGMSCAACSARVEKAVSKVPGVDSCSVSLLTNSMGVERRGMAPRKRAQKKRPPALRRRSGSWRITKLQGFGNGCGGPLDF